MAKLDILYHSCPYDLSGYGIVSRNHLIEMNKIEDLNIRLKVRKFWTGVSPDLGKTKEVLQSLERTSINVDSFIFIQHLTPENFFIDPRAKYHIAYTPFETDGAPLQWLLPLRAIDEIWVPSHYNKQAYAKAGIDPLKIRVIPHGVDVDKYNPEVTPLKYNRGNFNFGSVFDWTDRKNPIALIRAYYNAFFKDEDVTLTLRTFWRFPYERSREYINGQINAIKAGYQSRKTFPKILVWFDTMEEDIMPNFYKSFDCFVLPTRGEGFGLPFLEAMACDVPVIGPAAGGNREFMNSNNSIIVGGSIVPIENGPFTKLQPQYSGQRWFNIDEQELAKSMRWVYDNYDKAKEISKQGLVDAQKKWTWKNTAKQINDRLQKIYKGLSEINNIGISAERVVK